jgi:hypothetical protein
MWSSPPTSQNNLYIFDDTSLQVKGAVEGLAPGERIYAVRFTGETAYVVTFRQVDPLFVIDLSQPSRPLVRGQLKVPGFSEYLHPISSTQVLGVGHDATETGARAVTTGVKLSLFDVADPSKPLELDSKVLGERGSSSLVTADHKAFLFHKASGLLVVPMHLRQVSAALKAQGGGDATRVLYGDEVCFSSPGCACVVSMSYSIDTSQGKTPVARMVRGQAACPWCSRLAGDSSGQGYDAGPVSHADCLLQWFVGTSSGGSWVLVAVVRECLLRWFVGVGLVR